MSLNSCLLQSVVRSEKKLVKRTRTAMFPFFFGRIHPLLSKVDTRYRQVYETGKANNGSQWLVGSDRLRRGRGKQGRS